MPRSVARALQRALLLVLTAAVLLLFYLWFTLLSPFGYNPPPDLPAIDAQHPHEVFAYGTLTRPWVRRLVMGRAGEARPAALPGYRREGLDILPDLSASTDGVVVEVDARELARLDRYERLGIRYERVRKTLEDGSDAWVYQRITGGEVSP
ncbi:gamma-glutamylcyclotransferase family protein [Isoalcanivorax indicus]|uniref:gamma-glutamylcyclotransferase family protein n=1 Tax=Isoalcanivorax indicus TaxID=2202653 RepID=UPI000DB9CB06|nr:gamma-glutamylcyclotransferase family protein [Isoalcanivorax indicus]